MIAILLAATLSSAIRAHMTFLADDMLEGRGTATRGHEIAARYVAAQFEAIGLETKLQPVPMRRAELIPTESRVELVQANGERRVLAAGKDCIMAGDFRGATDVEAPLVFAGFGITAPEHQYDDYKNIDARGKIVAVTGGAPRELNAEERAHYASTKGENAAAHGAIGIVRLWTAEDETSGTWDATVRSYSNIGSYAWLEGNTPHPFLPQLQGTAWIGPTPQLPPRIRIVNKSKTADVESPNVVGILRGSDPALRNEYVVYSAHLDHLGIAEPVRGDAIYNGAVDNASGVAALIEIARMLAAAPPRRSVLFVAVTGEEPGLIGSDYFAQHTTVPRDAIVADINIDGLSMWPFEALFARGADHSTLSTNVEASGETIVPDPFPDQAGFVRSDQYSFVRIGVPSVILGAGKRPPDARAQALNWLNTRYHQPSDDMSQPLDFAAAARFTTALFAIGQSVAQQDARPKWNKGDFFGTRFGTAATKGE